jgi:hypothetical protein
MTDSGGGPADFSTSAEIYFFGARLGLAGHVEPTGFNGAGVPRAAAARALTSFNKCCVAISPCII